MSDKKITLPQFAGHVQEGLNTLGAALDVDQNPQTLTVGAFDSLVSKAKTAGIKLDQAIEPGNSQGDDSEVNPIYVDLYGSNRIDDWEKVVAAKIRAISHKASEGTTIKDSFIKARWPLMKQHGLLRQAYLFYRFGLGVSQQWENFQSVMGDLWDNDLPHELDLGEVSLNPSQRLWDEALGLMQKMEAATGKIPWCYGAWGLLKQYQLPKEFARYPLSVADLSYRPPTIPPPWTGFIAHQHAVDLSTVPGLGAGADLDYFHGTLGQFRAL